MRPPIARMGVVIPAANEEEHLPACLASLQVARERVERLGIDVRIVVVLDCCTDASAEIVAASPRVEAVTLDRRSVGAARGAGSAHLIASDPDPGGLFLANTDADSVVPPDWLETMLAADVDLVLGTVLPCPVLAPELMARWHELHDLVRGHLHVHGANLGVRADVLGAVGGWLPLTIDEDIDLALRVEAVPGAQVLRTELAPVLTSSRMVGRVLAGFSGYLRQLAVEHGELAG